jgi:hypothetical protein
VGSKRSQNQARQLRSLRPQLETSEPQYEGESLPRLRTSRTSQLHDLGRWDSNGQRSTAARGLKSRARLYLVKGSVSDLAQGQSERSERLFCTCTVTLNSTLKSSSSSRCLWIMCISLNVCN